MNGYGSRKFIVTMSGMFMCFVLAMVAMLLAVDAGANAYLGIGAGIAAYNYANYKQANGGNHGN